jgi:hypothetical protein
MSPAAACRILAHSYSVVLPVASLPFPPLPLPPGRDGPTNYGPLPAAATPWLQLVLYAAAGCGPPSLVIPAGRRLLRLPPLLAGCSAVLVWPWDCRAVRAPRCAPTALPAAALLASLNQYLAKTAVLVQPLHGAMPAEGAQNEAQQESALKGMTLDVPLPLPLALDPAGSSSSRTSRVESGGEDWSDFAAGPGAGALSVKAFAGDGGEEEVQLPADCASALKALGLGGAVGTLRVLRDAGTTPARWVPLHLTLGLPLSPPHLCQVVCDGAAAAGFLSAAACAAHTEGQRTLHAAMQALAGQHGLAVGQAAGGGDLSPAAVAFPAHCLEMDGAGRLRREALAASLQGGVGLLG